MAMMATLVVARWFGPRVVVPSFAEHWSRLSWPSAWDVDSGDDDDGGAKDPAIVVVVVFSDNFVSETWW
jgi:hypothetical protein